MKGGHLTEPGSCTECGRPWWPEPVEQGTRGDSCAETALDTTGELPGLGWSSMGKEVIQCMGKTRQTVVE